MREILIRINEWWERGEVPPTMVPRTRRFVISEIVPLLDERRITGIIGPRRTGKTTLMLQLMDMLIKERRLNPRNILFLPCDDILLKGRKDLIGEAITVYFEEILKRDYRSERVYIFIDEIHTIADWQLWLKRYYDLAYNIKFVISGSSVAKIKKKQRESLVGRIDEIPLFPLAFSEFLSFKEGGPGRAVERVPLFKMGLRTLEAAGKDIGPNRALKMRAILDEYMLVGGLPEWHHMSDSRLWQTRLRDDVVKRVIYDDIAQLYNVRNGAKIESLLKLMSAPQSRTFSYKSIGDHLRIDNETTGQYVYYLTESLLLFELMNYSSTREKQLRRNYRYVLVDTGIRNAIEHNLKLPSSQEALGHIVEGVVLQHILWNARTEGWEVFYWLDKDEVDIVVKFGKALLPIEVKYSDNPTRSDIKGLLRFMREYRADRGIVVTKDKFLKENIDSREVVYIPLWLFLSSL
jgi:predicted AAA+ superfamily ATPase